jgi:hypothetical protein
VATLATSMLRNLMMGGLSFDSSIVNVNDVDENGCPHLSIDNRGIVHTVWIRGPAHYPSNIYYDRSIDAGISFGTDTRVDHGDSTCSFPKSDVDKNGDI